MATVSIADVHFYGTLTTDPGPTNAFGVYVHALGRFIEQRGIDAEYKGYLAELRITSFVAPAVNFIRPLAALPPETRFTGSPMYMDKIGYGIKTQNNLFVPAKKDDEKLERYLHALLDQQVEFTTGKDKPGFYIYEVEPRFPRFPLVRHRGKLLVDQQKGWYVQDSTRNLRVDAGPKALSRFFGKAPWTPNVDVLYMEFNLKHERKIVADYLCLQKSREVLVLIGQLGTCRSHRGSKVGLQLKMPFVAPETAKRLGNLDRSLHPKYYMPDTIFTPDQGPFPLTQLAAAGPWLQLTVMPDGALGRIDVLTNNLSVKEDSKWQTTLRKRQEQQSVI